jgi:hypothetical protein
VVVKEDGSLDRVKHKIASVLEYELENIDKFCMDLAMGKISIC